MVNVARDVNGALVAPKAFVRIGRGHLYYGGTVAHVIDVHPMNVLNVEMFNGKRFRINAADTELQVK